MTEEDLKPGQVLIHGKVYDTVARRLHLLRDEKPDWSIETHMVENGMDVVFRAVVKDEHERIVSTGYAEENRAASDINKTSAIECCETSAVGRALGFAHWPGAEEHASVATAQEVSDAILKQQFIKGTEEMVSYMQAVRAEWESIVAIKQYIADDNLSAALEAWRELGEETMRKLWKAPSKGGVFTTSERNAINEASTEDFKAKKAAGEFDQ